MNKLLNKIGIAIVGMAMAVGVGVAAGRNNSKMASAAAQTVEKTSFTAVSDTMDSYIRYDSYKGGGTTNPAISGSNIRLYQNSDGNPGGIIVVSVIENSGATITKISITSNNDTTMGWQSGAHSSDTTKSNYTSVSLTANTAWDTGTISVTAYTFCCLGNTTGTRLNIKALKVWYDDGKAAAVVSGVSITGTTEVTSGTKGLAQTQLTGTVSYSSGTGNQGLTWESKAPAVATVSQTGLVTFLDNGSAEIKATSKEDSNYSASVTVTASNLEPAKGGSDNPFTPAEIKTFIDSAYDGESTLYAKGIISQIGDWDTKFNNANIFLTDNGNNDSTNKIEIFRFADETKYGQIALGDYVVVSGVWTNYNGIYETTQGNSDINIGSISKVSSLAATATTTSFPRGTVVTASNFTVNATYANGYVANGVTGFTFTVNGTAGGALVEGDNAIVISYLGKTADVNITGTVSHATSVSVDESASVYVGLKVQLTATILPEGQSDDIVWVSGTPANATIDQTGLVTGVKAGTSTITVFADKNLNGVKDEGELFDTCEVTVSDRVATALSISGKKTTFSSGDGFTVGGTIQATFEDDSEHPVTIAQDNEHLTYYIGTQSDVNAKTADTISIGDTLTAEHDGLYVKAFYDDIGATAYQISVIYPFDYSNGTFYKVTVAPEDWTGLYIVVNEEYKYAFQGEDASKTATTITIDSSNRISPVDKLAVLDIAAMTGGYSIKVRNGAYINKYLGQKTDATNLSQNADPVANTISLDASGNVDISSSSTHFRFNKASDQLRFRFYKSNSYSSQEQVQIYKYRANSDVVAEFVSANMHLTDIPVSEASRQSAGETCKTYYATAKAALTALTDAQIALFKSDDTFNDAQERYESWAEIYGDTTPYSKDVTPKAGVVGVSISNNNGTMIIVIIAAVLTTITIGGVFLTKKKKD